MDILSRILSYEDQVYQEYSTKRAKLLKHISEIDTTALTKEQMCIFIHDVKSIIEPIKTSISEIDYYFTNIDFKKTESLEHFNQIKSTSVIYLLFLGLYSCSETEETETPLSEVSSLSLSVPDSDVSSSESKSSRSVSLTFSNNFKES